MSTQSAFTAVDKPILDALTGQYSERTIHPSQHPSLRAREDRVLFGPLRVEAVDATEDAPKSSGLPPESLCVARLSWPNSSQHPRPLVRQLQRHTGTKRPPRPPCRRSSRSRSTCTRGASPTRPRRPTGKSRASCGKCCAARRDVCKRPRPRRQDQWRAAGRRAVRYPNDKKPSDATRLISS